MPSLSSISSSRFLRNEWILCLAAIVAVEAFLQHWGPHRLHNHEVDARLDTISSKAFKSPVVLLGDSVGLQVFRRWEPKRNRFAVLASNQAIGWPGQYFLLRRYLERNPPPHSVVFMGLSTFGNQLDPSFRENYIERCFVRPSEIASLLSVVHDPVMALRSALYGLLPSYRYRTKLRERLVGDTWQWPTAAGTAHGGGDPHHGLFHMIAAGVENRLKTPPANDTYFLKFVHLCRERGIDFFYIPAPVSSANHNQKKRFSERDQPFLRRLQEEQPHFTLCDDLYREYPPEDFGDGTHLNHDPLVRHRDEVVRGRLLAILERRARKQDGVTQR